MKQYSKIIVLYPRLSDGNEGSDGYAPCSVCCTAFVNFFIDYE